MNTTTIGLVAASSLPTAVYAASSKIPDINFFQEHAGLAMATLSISMGIIAFFLNRTLRQNDEQHKAMMAGITKLWQAHDAKAQTLSRLQGEHNILMRGKFGGNSLEEHCKRED